MKGFFSSTSVLLAATIIALAASIATIEQTSIESQVITLNNQIASELHQDSIEVAFSSLTRVIAASAAAATCNNLNFNQELQNRIEQMQNAVENADLKTTLENLNFEIEENAPIKIKATAQLTTTIEEVQIQKAVEMHEKLEITTQAGQAPNVQIVTLNITNLNTTDYKQFTFQC